MNVIIFVHMHTQREDIQNSVENAEMCFHGLLPVYALPLHLSPELD